MYTHSDIAHIDLVPKFVGIICTIPEDSSCIMNTGTAYQAFSFAVQFNQSGNFYRWIGIKPQLHMMVLTMAILEVQVYLILLQVQ
mmetsp:Transcript_4088/g.3420  ORF Transcript_4088/g.3420 Transcript_4088/m.3420 type:complete len:85 (+) Transcript_4088:207-461(+)